MSKNMKIPTPFDGTRVDVFSKRTKKWHSGLLNYVCTNYIPSHGFVAYFDRMPVIDIDLDSIRPMSDRIFDKKYH